MAQKVNSMSSILLLLENKAMPPWAPLPCLTSLSCPTTPDQHMGGISSFIHSSIHLPTPQTESTSLSTRIHLPPPPWIPHLPLAAAAMPPPSKAGTAIASYWPCHRWPSSSHEPTSALLELRASRCSCHVLLSHMRSRSCRRAWEGEPWTTSAAVVDPRGGGPAPSYARAELGI